MMPRSAVEDHLESLSEMSATEAASRLLGSDLIRNINGKLLVGRIVEVEAYDQDDPASHSFNGKTKRNAVMFGPAGFAYVYFTYGMHFCMNVVVGPEDNAAAVLIRALQPLQGESIMLKNRGNNHENLLTGPARLAQAFKIDKTLNGHDLRRDPLRLVLNPPLSAKEIKWSKRIGIREEANQDKNWRAVVANSKYLSRPL